MGAYNLMTIVSFVLDITPLVIMLWTWFERLLVRRFMHLMEPEMDKRVNEIVEERIKEYERQQENEKAKENAASVLEKLRRLFKS